MSYILDALKKNEAEENPELQASLELHRQSHRAHSWGLYLIAAALIGNLTVLVWLFGPYSGNSPAATQPGADQTSITEPARSTVPTTTPEAPPSAAADPVARQAPAQPQAPADRTAQSVPAVDQESGSQSLQPEKPPAPVTSKLIHTNLAGMSDAARARFPELSFSTHVYAADPSLRAVVVNGERLTEGDSLGNLNLANITESGVVFRFENYLVSISVLDDWD